MGTCERRKLRRTANQGQPELIVCSRLRHAVERGSRLSRERREQRIVLDVLDRLLVGKRDLHSGIEDIRGIEGFLYHRECAQSVLVPDAIEQRCSETAVAVLTGERPSKPCRE